MNMKKVACAICGGLFGNITASHLKKHGLTTLDYRRLYPNESKHVSSSKFLYGFKCKPEEHKKIIA